MAKVKTNELIGAALDWAVQEIEYQRMVAEGEHVKQWVLDDHRAGAGINHYSTNWLWGGPIIQREGLNLSVDYQDDALSDDMVQIGWKGNLWNNSVPGTAGFLQWAYGPTPLIAAMRCFCCDKLGDTAEVPEGIP